MRILASRDVSIAYWKEPSQRSTGMNEFHCSILTLNSSQACFVWKSCHFWITSSSHSRQCCIFSSFWFRVWTSCSSMRRYSGSFTVTSWVSSWSSSLSKKNNDRINMYSMKETVHVESHIGTDWCLRVVGVADLITRGLPLFLGLRRGLPTVLFILLWGETRKFDLPPNQCRQKNGPFSAEIWVWLLAGPTKRKLSKSEVTNYGLLIVRFVGKKVQIKALISPGRPEQGKAALWSAVDYKLQPIERRSFRELCR